NAGRERACCCAGNGLSNGMCRITRTLRWLVMCLPMVASAQIDPAKRDLVQFGYNQPVEGRAPLAGYMYYYHNQPDFLRTNLTLRLALAPTYLDSELGLGHALGPNTDLGLGLAGGGFADSYNEIRGGKWIEGESFDGHGAELSANIYHLFNPGQLVPLNLVMRGAAHYSTFDRNETAANFQLPEDGGNFSFRTGLRWGGFAPTAAATASIATAAWNRSRTGSGVRRRSPTRCRKAGRIFSCASSAARA